MYWVKWKGGGVEKATCRYLPAIFFKDQSLKACFIKKNVRRYLFVSKLQGVGADILLYSVTARVTRVLVISKKMFLKLHLY